MVGISQGRYFFARTGHNGTYFSAGYALIAVSLALATYSVVRQRPLIGSAFGVSAAPGVGTDSGNYASAGDRVIGESAGASMPIALARAKRTMLIGAGIMVAGIVLLVVTLITTPGGFVVYGPILLGVIVFLNGLRARRRVKGMVSDQPAGSAPGVARDSGSDQSNQVFDDVMTVGGRPSPVIAADVGGDRASSGRSGTNGRQDASADTQNGRAASFCTACGATRSPEGRFCASCGQAHVTQGG